MTDDEAHRRRLVATAGHRGDDAVVRAHLGDPVAAVRASALRAAARTGSLGAPDLEAGLADPDVVVRRTAAELAAARPGVVDLVSVLHDPDATVVEMAAWSLGEWGESASPQVVAVEAIAVGHPDSLCREAAVAALGAIGATRSLTTVIAALDDRATVRRRAAVALAAFDDPDADEALRRCLDDRDWQVRQVAEDLLDPRRSLDGPDA